MGTSKPTMVYSGNIEDFAAFWSYFITCVDGRNIKNQEQYRGMVGNLLYLASWTRIDIAMAVSELSVRI